MCGKGARPTAADRAVVNQSALGDGTDATSGNVARGHAPAPGAVARAPLSVASRRVPCGAVRTCGEDAGSAEVAWASAASGWRKLTYCLVS